jgi:CheY-like chemotaxis protein
VDANRLRQVVTNLVGNAIKFTENGGVLVSAEIERGEKGSCLRIAVRDTGIGVPPDKQKAIFDEFVQVGSGGREGAGLGLAISKRLVEAMGGQIGMQPAADRGSIFWFKIPLEETAACGTGREPARRGRAALVSASPVLHASLRLQLEAAGMEMIALQSLESGPAAAIECDVVLFDAPNSLENLPDFSGAPAPVAVLLPPKGRAQLADLTAKGAAFYLTKPVRQASLERRLGAALSLQSEAGVTGRSCAPRPVPHHSYSVLLAEDNPVSALLARELLRRRGHHVDEVYGGEETIRARMIADYDLIVMDIRMPGVDGIEAAKRIRAWESAAARPRTAIIALSADVTEAGRRACLEAGMDGFLVKPVDPDALDNALAALNPPATAAA